MTEEQQEYLDMVKDELRNRGYYEDDEINKIIEMSDFEALLTENTECVLTVSIDHSVDDILHAVIRKHLATLDVPKEDSDEEEK